MLPSPRRLHYALSVRLSIRLSRAHPTNTEERLPKSRITGRAIFDQKFKSCASQLEKKIWKSYLRIRLQKVNQFKWKEENPQSRHTYPQNWNILGFIWRKSDHLRGINGQKRLWHFCVVDLYLNLCPFKVKLKWGNSCEIFLCIWSKFLRSYGIFAIFACLILTFWLFKVKNVMGQFSDHCSTCWLSLKLNPTILCDGRTDGRMDGRWRDKRTDLPQRDAVQNNTFPPMVSKQVTMHWLRCHVKDIAGAPYKIKENPPKN